MLQIASGLIILIIINCLFLLVLGVIAKVKPLNSPDIHKFKIKIRIRDLNKPEKKAFLAYFVSIIKYLFLIVAILVFAMFSLCLPGNINAYSHAGIVLLIIIVSSVLVMNQSGG